MMRRTVLLAVALMPLIGCDRTQSRQRKPVEIETVDVGSDFDSELSTETDKRAKRVQIDLGGVLPSDFPAELPIFSPASVVDFGPGFVEVDSPIPESEVHSSIHSQLVRSGWTVEATVDKSSTYSRAGLTVQIHLTAIGSGTRIRYQY